MTGHFLYTEEDVELIAEATLQHHIVSDTTDADGNSPCSCGKWWDSDQGADWDQHMAEVALAALSSANRLVPPGSEVREEWRVTGDPGQGYPPYDFTWRDGDPERAARAFIGLYASHKPWPIGPDLSHRKVITTPWSPSVPDTEEGS